MKKLFVSSLSAAVALTASVIVLPASPANAQAGSRICGYTIITPDGVVGYVYEGRTTDSTYKTECSKAILETQSKAASDPQIIRGLPGVSHKFSICEYVGALFMSANSPQDMCLKMEVNSTYKVTKNKASNSTTYEKQ